MKIQFQKKLYTSTISTIDIRRRKIGPTIIPNFTALPRPLSHITSLSRSWDYIEYKKGVENEQYMEPRADK